VVFKFKLVVLTIKKSNSLLLCFAINGLISKCKCDVSLFSLRIGGFLFRRLARYYSDDCLDFVPMFGGVSEYDWKMRCEIHVIKS